ncbi:MAG: hypothetical protein WBP94_17155, partial [Rhodomicrobiaceae bacterium]
LYEIDLWEVSIVTFPMLPGARVSAVKAACSPARHHALASDSCASILPNSGRCLRLDRCGKAPSAMLCGSPGHRQTAHSPARREARSGGGLPLRLASR